MASGKTAESRRPGRPPSGDTGSRRQDILKSAIDLFGAKGFEGVSLRQIADQASADVGLTRYYFGSKEDLWKAAIAHLASQLEAELIAVGDREFTSKTEMMKAVVRWFVDMSARRPQVSRIIAFDGNNDGMRGDYIAEKLVSPFYMVIGSLIEGARTEGTLIDMSPRTLFFMITHGGSFPMVLPVLTNRFPGGDIMESENLERHADAMIKLIFREL